MSKEKYLIWNGEYSGNSLVFHRENKQGYTCDIDQAHQFEFEEAKKMQSRSDGKQKPIALSHLEKISRRQVNADCLDHDLIGKEVSDV